MASFFSNKTFVITGGASGIGRETARALVSEGAAVSIADISPESLESTAAAIIEENPNAKVLTTTLDVRDPNAVAAWINSTEAKLGPIYGSVNAAGIATSSHFVHPIEDVPLEDWDRTIGINLTGVMLCMREQVRAMKKSKVNGSIVNITSAAGLTGIEMGGPYSASKWGVIGITRSVAKETAQFGIRVTGVAPGWVSTPLVTASPHAETIQTMMDGTPLGRGARAEEVSALIMFLLSDKASYITGSTHLVDGGICA
ncbi:hypothetical protein VTL71DRAFT_3051 [Oculimacula yallundae]|uniref:NAD(P)-binding protein n=1 Tax=Oculimacula yallundae TaxID=86028 RepID=A0ABR4C623_9HELO